MQGPHQVAQKSRTTTFPLRLARVSRPPERSGKSKAGAGRCLKEGAFAQAQARRTPMRTRRRTTTFHYRGLDGTIREGGRVERLRGSPAAVEPTPAQDDTGASGVVYLDDASRHGPSGDRHRRDRAQTKSGARHVPRTRRLGGHRLRCARRSLGRAHDEGRARPRRGPRLPSVLGRLLALGQAASGVASRGPGPARRGGRAGGRPRAPPVGGARKPDLAAPLSPRGRGLGPGRSPLRDDPGHARRLARVLARPPEPVPRPGRAERPGHPVLRVHGRQHQLVPAPHSRPPRRDEPRSRGHATSSWPRPWARSAKPTPGSRTSIACATSTFET